MIRPWNSLALRRAAFWLCAVFVLILALMPPNRYVPATPWDKANHMLAFAVLGLLGRSGWRDRGTAVWVGLLGYGAAIELLQALTPYRTADVMDLLADAVGLAVAAWAARLASQRRSGS